MVGQRKGAGLSLVKAMALESLCEDSAERCMNLSSVYAEKVGIDSAVTLS